MTYYFNYIVSGTSAQKVNIYRNGTLVSTRKGRDPSALVNFEVGDVFRQECLPAAEFVRACEDLYGTCETDPNYTATILISLYINVIFTFKTSAANAITSLSVVIGDANRPQQRTFTVKGTSHADFVYAIREGNNVITSTLHGGLDQFNIDNISYGTHTYCSDPSNICKTIEVTQPKWNCVNDCASPFAGGTYDTQAECMAACNPGSPPPPGTDNKAILIIIGLAIVYFALRGK